MIFDALRFAVNWLEALWEEFVLSRDPEFAESLRQADENLRAGRTVSLAQLRRGYDHEAE